MRFALYFERLLSIGPHVRLSFSMAFDVRFERLQTKEKNNTVDRILVLRILLCSTPGSCTSVNASTV